MGKKINVRLIFEKIAVESNTTVQEVQREMESVIRAGFKNPDPKIQEQWNRIPRAGDVPTPDELIRYIAGRAKEGNAGSLFQGYLNW